MKEKAFCVLDLQKKEFSFPFKKAYDKTVLAYQKAYLNLTILPTLKKTMREQELIIHTLDYKSEEWLTQQKIPFKSLRHLTENLWDYKRGKTAWNEIRNIEKAFTENNILHTYDGIDLIDMTAKDIWRSHIYNLTTLIDTFHSLLEQEKPTKVIIFSRTQYYQKLLLKCAYHHPVKIIDKTTTLQRAGEKMKKTAIRKMAHLNVPSYLRTPQPTQATPHFKTKKRRILISNNTITPRKIISFAKTLQESADILVVGAHQSPTPFDQEHIPFRHLKTYLTPNIKKRLEKNKNLFKTNEPRLTILGKNHPFVRGITYKKIMLFDFLEELFSFFSNARFYETAAYIELCEEMIRQEKPDVIVGLDEMSVYGRVLAKVAQKKGIPCTQVQPGIWAKSAIMDTTYSDKILVYGKTALDNLADSGIPKEKIRIVGLPEQWTDLDTAHTRKDVQEHFSLNHKTLFLFTSQAVPEGQNYPLFDAVYQAMRQFPKIGFIVKIHPAEKDTMHRIFLKKYPAKNVRIVKHGEYPLDKLLAACHCLLNYYSTVGIEALIRGKYLISVNLAGLPSFMLPKEHDGLVMTAHTPHDIKILISNVSKKKPQEKLIKDISREEVYATGEEACENVKKEILLMIQPPRKHT